MFMPTNFERIKDAVKIAIGPWSLADGCKLKADR
jgi:hypothetical protein